jgi:hypothetical protein
MQSLLPENSGSSFSRVCFLTDFFNVINAGGGVKHYKEIVSLIEFNDLILSYHIYWRD